MAKTYNSNSKVYFENLNTIRFIAASLVIIHHIEQFKNIFHIPNIWDDKTILIIGNLGVILFFVLSGFLISFLLFKEKEVTNTICIKNFYMRRILRIWPLYFLIVLSAFFIFPFINFFSLPGLGSNVVLNNLGYKLLLFVFFLPNANFFGLIPYASQTWSIGAEEQFYLIWPVLNKKINRKWLLMISVIFIYLFIKTVNLFLVDNVYVNIYKNFFDKAPIQCMAI